MAKSISEMTPSELAALQKMFDQAQAKKAKQAEYNERRRVWMMLMIEKAKKANIGVSEKEVNEVIAKAEADKKAKGK